MDTFSNSIPALFSRFFRKDNKITSSAFALTTALLFQSVPALSQPCTPSHCVNLGFELGNFNNWQSKQGTTITGNPTTCASVPVCTPTTWNMTSPASQGANNAVPNISETDHIFIYANDPAYFDPYCHTAVGIPDSCMIGVTPLGDIYFVRLGNPTNGYGAEQLSYTMVVDSCNASILYSFAIVLENPSHLCYAQPAFSVELLDQNGNIIPGPCGSYTVAQGCDPSFKTSVDYINDAFSTATYKCWTTLGMDLTPYMGQQITIRYTTMDCSQGGHAGWAYLDVTCSALLLNINTCSTDSATLIAPPGFASYQWIDPGGNPIPAPQGINDTLIVLNFTSGDIYQLNMISAGGCPTTLQATLNANPVTIPDAGSDQNQCNNGTFTLIGNTPTSGIGAWSVVSGTATITNPSSPASTVTGVPVGTCATLAWTISNATCSKQDLVVLCNNASPVADFIVSPTDTVLSGTNVTFTNTGSAGAGLSFEWDFGDLSGSQLENPTHIYTGSGERIITFIVTNALGCKDTMILRLIVLENIINIPNAFTPNGDGLNDKFLVYGRGIGEIEFKIYNQWGEIIYQTRNVSEAMTLGWNGRRNGRMQDIGVYVYVATGAFIDAKKFYKSGNVTLLK